MGKLAQPAVDFSGVRNGDAQTYIILLQKLATHIPSCLLSPFHNGKQNEKFSGKLRYDDGGMRVKEDI